MGPIIYDFHTRLGPIIHLPIDWCSSCSGYHSFPSCFLSVQQSFHEEIKKSVWMKHRFKEQSDRIYDGRNQTMIIIGWEHIRYRNYCSGLRAPMHAKLKARFLNHARRSNTTYILHETYISQISNPICNVSK